MKRYFSWIVLHKSEVGTLIDRIEDLKKELADCKFLKEEVILLKGEVTLLNGLLKEAMVK